MKRKKIWELKGTSDDELSLMGKIVFSANRVDGAETREPDTSFEKKLKKILDKHIYGDEITYPEAEHVIDALRNGEYPDYIHVPNVSEVYRGLSLKQHELIYLKKWLNLKTTDKLPESGVVEGNWTISSINSSASSFSVDFNVAKLYAGWDKPTQLTSAYSVILVSSVSGNQNRFFDLVDLYDTVDGYSNFSFEKEAVGLGPIKVYKIMFKVRNSLKK